MDEGPVITVVWPPGYTIQREPTVQLIGPRGEVLASEGHLIRVTGALSNNRFIGCGEVVRFTRN